MVATTHAASIQKHLRSLQDPRVVGRTRHRLLAIIVLAIGGVIGNGDDWPDIARFAEQRRSWCKRLLALPAGIPSHDPFERVFAALDPRAFERCCLAWLHEAAHLLGGGQIAIDGKTLCGSAGAARAWHLVSAWATQAQLTLGQVSVDKKGNEITALPKLWALLERKGALITIDALGCQKALAKQIVQREGDYVLVVKANQPHLLADVPETVRQALEGELPARVVHPSRTSESGHGRQEERSGVVVEHTCGIQERKDWSHLRAVGRCARERTGNGETTTQVCFFIGSRRRGARR